MNTYPLEYKGAGRRGWLRTETDRLLTASMVFSCGLVVIRMIHAHSLLFGFMIWNLFLAYVPYVLSSWVSRRLDRTLTLSLPIKRRPLFYAAVCLVWLLFIPNAFYMLTDLYHLSDSRSPRIPEWYDLALIFSFAWNGLLLGVLSLRQMERLVGSRRLGALIVYPVIGLSALGVYTGRYLRYNSWDIVSDPFFLMRDIAGMIIHPLRNQAAWDMILCYTILLSFIYTMLKKISRALN